MPYRRPSPHSPFHTSGWRWGQLLSASKDDVSFGRERAAPGSFPLTALAPTLGSPWLCPHLNFLLMVPSLLRLDLHHLDPCQGLQPASSSLGLLLSQSREVAFWFILFDAGPLTFGILREALALISPL